MQTDASSIPVHQSVVSDSTLRAGLASRGLVAVRLASLQMEILLNIGLHLRLDPTHSMEMLFTMNRIPRAAILSMWQKKTPSASDSDVLEYTWDSIERAMNCVDLEPHLPWGSKAAKLHKVRFKKSLTTASSAPYAAGLTWCAYNHRYRRRSLAGHYLCWAPPLWSGIPRRRSSCDSARRSTTFPTGG